MTKQINIVYSQLSVILAHQLKQDITCVMSNYNYKINGSHQESISFRIKSNDESFRFRCDDHSICEVSSEEVFKSEWFVETSIE